MGSFLRTYGMSFVGVVKNGVVVLPPEAQLADGAEVEIVPRNDASPDDPFWALIDKLAKDRPHWPEDLSLNHGYYTSGEPKRT
jgi:hypothetical protein